MEFGLMGISVGAALLGIWVGYRKTVLAQDAVRDQSFAWTRYCFNGFFVDAAYRKVLVLPLEGLSLFLKFLDQFFIDGFIKLLGYLSCRLGDLAEAWQSRRIKDSAAWMALGALLFICTLWGMQLWQ